MPEWVIASVHLIEAFGMFMQECQHGVLAYTKLPANTKATRNGKHSYFKA